MKDKIRRLCFAMMREKYRETGRAPYGCAEKLAEALGISEQHARNLLAGRAPGKQTEIILDYLFRDFGIK